MDEADSLEAVSNLLTQLNGNLYDISLHMKHIQLCAKLGESEVQLAREMLVGSLAAGEEVWVPLIEQKQSSEDLESRHGLEGVLAMFDQAERDYLSITILQKHLEFLISRHAHFQSQAIQPDDLEDLFSTEWTRAAVSAVVAKGIGHLTESHRLWDLQRDWEVEMLETATTAQRAELMDHVQSLHLQRLQQPHSNLEDTFQSYSSFTTNYRPPREYESRLVSASKLRSQAMKAYQRREASELALVQSEHALDAYAQYLAAERRAKKPDMFVIETLYERAISEAAKRRSRGEDGAEPMLRSFWVGYCDFLRIHGEESDELEVFQRGVRSVPGCGELWARYMRYSERSAESEDPPEDGEVTANIFQRAIDAKLIQTDVEQIVPVILARAGAEKRLLESGRADEDALVNLITVLESGIEMVHQASRTGDSRFRLEKYLAEIYLRLADMPDSAIGVWEKATKHYKSSYLVWTTYIDLLIKQDRHDDTRRIFKDLCMKNLDWPEAIWEAWISFEHLYGTVGEIDLCLEKLEKAQYQVNARRAKEAEKVAQAVQFIQDSLPTNISSVNGSQTVAEITSSTDAVTIDQPSDSGVKRKAENVPLESNKKARTAEPLKRDRENCTVFVADLHDQVAEDDLKALFKDCGEIRGVNITQLPGAVVAIVEFFERESVPAALTKDKKRIHGQEIAVHLAWKSTLYVTNFPEKSDDAFMRNLFSPYGTIFDIRWPSKKFKATRRFCYVQYTSPSSAGKALELHGRELEPGHALNVFISNPERKKERTDADADKRELYVAGLSKFTTKSDLENLFKPFGELKDVRITLDKDGHCKGFAFVEFENEDAAQSALAMNNHELKKRRMAVTMANSAVRPRNPQSNPDSGFGRQADVTNRSVRIRNLPKGIQEAVLQQTLEKYALVKRVEVFANLDEAAVELQNASEVGKLLLRTEPIIFNGSALEIHQEEQSATRSANKGPSSFVPRAALSRPRAGLGHTKSTKRVGAQPSAKSQNPASNPSGSSAASNKNQDDFRRMLGGA